MQTLLLIFINFIPVLIVCDCATPWQIGFQDPATPIIIGIIDFHNQVIIILIGIGIFVFWMLFRAVFCFTYKTNPVKFTHSTTLETTWTIVPAILLLFIAGPSFALLYSMDDFFQAEITLKVIGHQWYWAYEYNNYLSANKEKTEVKFDSYIISEEDLKKGSLRLLEVDHRTLLPLERKVEVLVTSSDVLHSWAVPSLGIKIDACPGRLNRIMLSILRPGVFYGQCSEICGVNHGFMPIVVESLEKSRFITWISKNLT
jgi:cytochrome c oxidase subunit 2